MDGWIMCKVMKRLVLLCGPNGIGKTSICHELLRITPQSAYVDSDPLRMMNPFVLSDETIPTVAKNIGDLIENYLDCPSVETVFFSYGFHGRRREIFERVMARLQMRELRFLPLLIWCDEEENVRRMRLDERDEARIARAIAVSRSAYANIDYPRIDVTNLNVSQAAQAVREKVFELENTYRIAALTQEFVRKIEYWMYPEPSETFGYLSDTEPFDERTNRGGVACVDGAGNLQGYFCFGDAARIPTRMRDVYDETAIDMETRLHPALCGQKRSGAFLRAGMTYAREKLGAKAFRVTVAGTNARAIRAYEKVGFVMVRKVWHKYSNEAFYVMRCDV